MYLSDRPMPRSGFYIIQLFSRDEATLCERVSVRRIVGPFVGRSVRNAFVKLDEKWMFRILDDGRGRKRGEEEKETRRKEG